MPTHQVDSTNPGPSRAVVYVNARALIERTAVDEPQLLLQLRDKPGQPARWELPGGQVEPYESLTGALRREVQEETGLIVTEIEESSTRVVDGRDGTRVECLRPFAVYQTLSGPVDSMGVYFRCRAEGQLLPAGDDTRRATWFGLDRLSSWLADEPDRFSWVDRAGLEFYLAEIARTDRAD